MRLDSRGGWTHLPDLDFREIIDKKKRLTWDMVLRRTRSERWQGKQKGKASLWRDEGGRSSGAEGWGMCTAVGVRKHMKLSALFRHQCFVRSQKLQKTTPKSSNPRTCSDSCNSPSISFLSPNHLSMLTSSGRTLFTRAATNRGNPYFYSNATPRHSRCSDSPCFFRGSCSAF